MAYDENFYKLYEEYLNEPTVHARHSLGWKLLDYPHNMVELGCGASQISEALRLNEVYPPYYVGIDLNTRPLHVNSATLKSYIQGDYREPTTLNKAMWLAVPDTVVSLFSSEITAPRFENYKLYRHIFEVYPTVQQMLVSGFYYTDKKDRNPVGESGGIVSYQTLETQEDVVQELFSEFRLTMPVPSKLFGPNVYEVWKLFKRN